MKRFSVAIAALVIAVVVPLSGISASSTHREGTWRLADGNTATLISIQRSAPAGSVNDISPMSQGYWNSGCLYAVYNGLGQLLYSYTIWQLFGSDGTKINYLPSPTNSSQTDLGWALTTNSNTHWWINSTHKDAAARGNWTFTQWVGGQPYRTASGWVRVQDNYHGTWSCYSS